MVNKNDIFSIGLGTWKIDYSNIDKELKGLMYSFQNGQNYLSLYMLYDNGKVVKSLKKFIDLIDREKLFITVNLEPKIEKLSDIEKQLNEYLSILNLEYVNSIQIHTPKVTSLPLIDVYKEMKRLVDLGKVKYLGISNCSLKQLKEIDSVVKIDFFEGVYNLECKVNENIGILDYCLNNEITFIPYQVLRRNKTQLRNYEVLVELAKKYNKTQNQIILNWIIKEKHMKPIIKCTNIERIKENLEAINFTMDKSDYKKLNDFRSEEFDNIKIDWENTNDGISIDQLPNQFD